MRFLFPAQTIAEYKHRKFPVYETLGISAGTLATAAVVGAAGAAASYGLSQLNKPPGAPNFSQYVPTQDQYNAAQLAEEQNLLGSGFQPSTTGFARQFAREGTQQQINLQNLVSPGSSAQRKLATQQLNSYIQGQVPQDVQQQINREVAQNLGGGFNLYSGGGQAPQNFARNLGQTSLGLSQYGLSAAPTWQQLANQMVVSPVTGAQIGLQAGQLANQQVGQTAGYGMQGQENQYTAQQNQYLANQQQIQNAVQTGMSAANLGIGAMNANTLGSYYGAISSQPNAQGFYTNPTAAMNAATGENGVVGSYASVPGTNQWYVGQPYANPGMSSQ